MNIKYFFKKIYIIFLSGLVLYGLSLVVINQWQLRLHPNKRVLDAAKIYENDMHYLASRLGDKDWRFQSFRGMDNQGFSFFNTFKFSGCRTHKEIDLFFTEIGILNTYQDEYKKEGVYKFSTHAPDGACNSLFISGTSSIEND